MRNLQGTSWFWLLFLEEHIGTCFFFKTKRAPAPVSFIRRKPPGLQPKVNEFNGKRKLPSTRPKPKFRTHTNSLRTHYRTSKGAGTSDTARYSASGALSCQTTAQHGWTLVSQWGLPTPKFLVCSIQIFISAIYRIFFPRYANVWS
jgi:hypothetical protein